MHNRSMSDHSPLYAVVILALGLGIVARRPNVPDASAGTGSRPRPRPPAGSRGVPDDQAFVSRGMSLTVAERARAPIIGLRYGLPWYFAL